MLLSLFVSSHLPIFLSYLFVLPSLSVLQLMILPLLRVSSTFPSLVLFLLRTVTHFLHVLVRTNVPSGSQRLINQSDKFTFTFSSLYAVQGDTVVG
jgi:hypothetical protein